MANFKTQNSGRDFLENLMIENSELKQKIHYLELGIDLLREQLGWEQIDHSEKYASNKEQMMRYITNMG